MGCWHRWASCLECNQHQPAFARQLRWKYHWLNHPQSPSPPTQHPSLSKFKPPSPANKGNSTVVLDKTVYLAEAERQLSTYQPLSLDPTSTFNTDLSNFLTTAGPSQGLSKDDIPSPQSQTPHPIPLLPSQSPWTQQSWPSHCRLLLLIHWTCFRVHRRPSSNPFSPT